MIILFWVFISIMMLAALGFIVYPLRDSKITAFLVVIFIFIVALLMYLHVGDYLGWKRYEQLKAESAQVKAMLARIKNPQQFIDQLQQHLRDDPGSAEGWFLLGKLYSDNNQWVQAKNALYRAYELSPHNDQYVLDYVQADFFVSGRRLSLEDVALLAPILKHDPNNVNVINLLAIDAYLQHHYQTAVTYWERLLLIFPSDSQDSEAVLQMIAKAQKNIRRVEVK